MTTDPQDPGRLDAFVDGELDLQQQLGLEEQLRHDAALRSQVESLRAVRGAVRELAAYHAAPADLHARVAGMLGTRPGRAAPASRRRNWMPWTAASAFAAAALVAVTLLLWPAREDARIEHDVIASHVRATLGQRSVDVASADHHKLKPWLSSKLDFSPPVHELEATGSALVGGRIDYVDGRPVAVLVYTHGAHTADEFVWPTPGGDSGVSLSAERGFNVAHWRKGGMAHWLVSDMGAAELSGLAQRLDSVD